MEIWKKIPNFEDYEVSNLGRVRSIDRQIIMKNRWGQYSAKTIKGKILRPGWHSKSHPYPQVMLGRNNCRRVHNLVALAFLGEKPSPDHIVLHRDGDCTNCRVENLMYGTQRDNQIDRFAHGTHYGKMAGSKLSESQVLEIKSRLLKGESQDSIAKSFGVTQSTISHIKTLRDWSWL